MIWHKAEDSEKKKTIFLMEKEKNTNAVHAFFF